MTAVSGNTTKHRVHLILILALANGGCEGIAGLSRFSEGEPSTADDTGEETPEVATGDAPPGHDDGVEDSLLTEPDSTADTSAGFDTGKPDAIDADAAGPDACSALGASACMAAASLPAVSGDTGSSIQTKSGSDNAFFAVLVTEDDTATFASKDPKVRLSLKSLGANFDLYAYLGPTVGDGGGRECSVIKGVSTAITEDDVISLAWNDNRPVGGHDDSRVVIVEVRSSDSLCGAGSWTLTVEGNK